MEGVQSVLGTVSPQELGVVLPHEHILSDFSKGIVPHPLLPDGRDLASLPLTLENAGLVWRFPYSVRGNLLLDEVEQALEEVQLYKSSRGGSICEMSVVGFRRRNHDPTDLKNISKATGVHIISATGFYCDQLLPDWAKEMSVQDMADFMMREVVTGVGDSGVKCGVMYIGCSHPLRDTETRALQAAAITHKQTGVAMAVCPGRSPQSPFDIMDMLSHEGVPARAICMAHMDRTFTGSTYDLKKMCELCQRGCFVDHSLFGKECSHYQCASEFDFPSDAQRIQRVKGLIASGCVERVLMSQDVVCKNEWVGYGGKGYAHLLEHILPKFLDRGVDRCTMETILKQNPRNWLAIGAR